MFLLLHSISMYSLSLQTTIFKLKKYCLSSSDFICFTSFITSFQWHTPWGSQGAGHSPNYTHTHTSIFEPNKIQNFQFQTSGILSFTNVQKLYGPEISQFLSCILQFLDNLFLFFLIHKGNRALHVGLLKRSNT